MGCIARGRTPMNIHEVFQEECGKLNVNWPVNDRLVCLEFLDGPVFIVDSVSRRKLQ